MEETEPIVKDFMPQCWLLRVSVHAHDKILSFRRTKDLFRTSFFVHATTLLLALERTNELSLFEQAESSVKLWKPVETNGGFGD